MAKINIEIEEEKHGSAVFAVQVTEGGTSSDHKVTVKDEDYQRLAPEGVSRRELVEESFRFLLEREPKSSILSSFELTVIGNYFPEYEDKIGERLMA